MDKIALDYAEKIKMKLKDNLIRIILFGSRARGDNKDFSDYDFLIVLNDVNKYCKDTIIDEEVEILNKYDKLASTIVYSSNEWENIKKFPLGINILKEGINL